MKWNSLITKTMCKCHVHKQQHGKTFPDDNRDARGVKLFHIKVVHLPIINMFSSLKYNSISYSMCDPLSIIILSNFLEFHSQFLSWRVSKLEDFHFCRRFLTDFAVCKIFWKPFSQLISVNKTKVNFSFARKTIRNNFH